MLWVFEIAFNVVAVLVQLVHQLTVAMNIEFLFRKLFVFVSFLAHDNGHFHRPHILQLHLAQILFAIAL